MSRLEEIMWGCLVGFILLVGIAVLFVGIEIYSPRTNQPSILGGVLVGILLHVGVAALFIGIEICDPYPRSNQAEDNSD